MNHHSDPNVMTDHRHAPSPDETFGDDDVDFGRPTWASLWRENHGNFLVFFVTVIFAAGSGILACRQLRFVPPRFPESSAIAPPVEEDPESEDVEADEPASVDPVDTSPPADDVSDAAEILLEALGAVNDDGVMMFAVYQSADGFNQPEQAVMRQKIPITEGRATLRLPVDDLPGRFAVAVFHDENADGELNRNVLGIPSERYGFSNNARSMSGPPAFEEALVDRPTPGTPLRVSIR